ncbi:hypothetical protein DN448_10160 [Lactobacillus reuteri]|nr:hypothetical protein [Limosilactobacillus reuteri]MQB85393.1 hypothetical protein [Limosilactobacillus reuteri]
MDCTVTPLKTLMVFSAHLNVQLKFYNLPYTKNAGKPTILNRRFPTFYSRPLHICLITYRIVKTKILRAFCHGQKRSRLNVIFKMSKRHA